MIVSQTLPDLYPLRFQEILRNYGFGDRWIVEVFEKEGLPEDHRVAETWEVVDRPGESSEIVYGPLAGQTLHEALEQYGKRLLGADVVARTGQRFPLLIKFLDASNPLGEQIHPTDEQAPLFKRGDDPGKTEAWYMLYARPGATIHCGCKPDLDRDALVEALKHKASRDCMVEYEVKAGDSFLLYANTMHYSKGGVLFYEIMQNSDITVGLNRVPDDPDELDQAVEEMADWIHLETPFDCRTKQVTVAQGANRQTYIFACHNFALERWDLTEPLALTPDGQRFHVYSVVDGHVTLRYDDHVERLVSGNSFLVPAEMAPLRIEPEGEASVLCAYVPDLMANVIEPLRARGVADADIEGLGGVTRLNHLAPLLNG
jgi:mannose-6-phosphate isomerase